jgi:hypothetical protein
MSEYQYYEFLALDRPLTENQRAELRSISTRAASQCHQVTLGTRANGGLEIARRH